MASKLCDSCKSATATLFCRPDSAFLCVSCDSKIHAANKLASRHARVYVCEVCEQAPAHVTCKADAASLCVSCDRDIHSANPLARRHERVPITPFYDPLTSVHNKANAVSHCLDDRYLSDADFSREEAEAASWLIPNPPSTKLMESTGRCVFSYLDQDYRSVDPKLEAQEQNSSATDGVVPVQSNKDDVQPPFINDNCFEIDFTASKPFPYGYITGTQCPSNSVSSSSIEAGVVPDGGDSKSGAESGSQVAVQLSGVEREARVLRYREKRKNRKFEKTIRYASRKAYAETRPRIKGRFAKRTDLDGEQDRNAANNSIYGFGVVPSF